MRACRFFRRFCERIVLAHDLGEGLVQVYLALDQVAGPGQVLHEEGLVEAVLLLQRGDLGGIDRSALGLQLGDMD